MNLNTCVIFLFLFLACFYCHPDNNNVIEYLIPLIIQAESSGNPNASDGRSFGLMGISECVLEDFNNEVRQSRVGTTISSQGQYRKFFILKEQYSKELIIKYPHLNKEVGRWYLYKIQSWLPEEYKNSKPHIIFAYNSGIGKLRELNYEIPGWTKKHPNKIYRKIYWGEL